MHKNEQLSDTWFMPFRQNALPPFTKEIKGFACTVALLSLLFLCAIYLIPQQLNKSFGTNSIKNEQKEIANYKLQQNDIYGAMKTLTHAITIEKNKFNIFDPRVQEALNQRDFDPLILELETLK